MGKGSSLSECINPESFSTFAQSLLPGPLQYNDIGPQRWSKGWSTSPMRKGWESWGCLPWRREGCGETSEQPFSNWRVPIGKLGKIFSAGLVEIGQGVMVLNEGGVDLD